MLKLTLKSGEIITGTPNYVTAKVAEIKVGTKYRTVDRAQIAKTERVKRRTTITEGNDASTRARTRF